MTCDAGVASKGKHDGRGLTSTTLPPQLTEQPSRVTEMIVEDPAGDIEQLADEWVTERVSHRQSFLLRGDDALVAEHGQLLRDDWLLEGQYLLQFLHRTSPSLEDLQHSDPRGMGQGSEKLRLEGLKLTGDHRFTGLPTALLRHQ
jgi:hypothetical protein